MQRKAVALDHVCLWKWRWMAEGCVGNLCRFSVRTCERLIKIHTGDSLVNFCVQRSHPCLKVLVWVSCGLHDVVWRYHFIPHVTSCFCSSLSLWYATAARLWEHHVWTASVHVRTSVYGQLLIREHLLVCRYNPAWWNDMYPKSTILHGLSVGTRRQ